MDISVLVVCGGVEIEPKTTRNKYWFVACPSICFHLRSWTRVLASVSFAPDCRRPWERSTAKCLNFNSGSWCTIAKRGAFFPRFRITIESNVVGPLQYDRSFVSVCVRQPLLGTMLPSNPQSIRVIARWGNSAFMMWFALVAEHQYLWELGANVTRCNHSPPVICVLMPQGVDETVDCQRCRPTLFHFFNQIFDSTRNIHRHNGHRAPNDRAGIKRAGSISTNSARNKRINIQWLSEITRFAHRYQRGKKERGNFKHTEQMQPGNRIKY